MTYSQSLSINKQNVYRRNQNTYSLKSARVSFGPVSTIVITLALMCLMGMIYLSQVTRTNTYGYRVSSLAQKEQDLQREKADLELEAVRLQSIEQVKKSQVATSMQPVQPSSYAH